MPSDLAQTTTVIVALVGGVALWRALGRVEARDDERDAKEIVRAWWDERRLVVGLLGVGLLALAFLSMMDAAALTLALGTWTLAEQARTLRAGGHHTHALERALGASVIGALIASSGIMLAPFDGVFLALGALALAGVLALRALRRRSDEAFRTALRAAIPALFFVPMLFLTPRIAPWPQTTLDDAVGEASRIPPVATIDERLMSHLDAAGVEYAREDALERWHMHLAAVRGRSFIVYLEPLVRLGAESDDEIARWREMSDGHSPRDLERSATSLLMAARHGPTGVAQDELARLALDHAAEGFDEGFPLERAMLAHDVLELVGTPDDRAALRDTAHRLLRGLWVVRPSSETATFAWNSEQAQEWRDAWSAPHVVGTTVSDAVRLMRRVGVPDGIDVPSLARGLDLARRRRHFGRRDPLAPAVLAELETWPEARLGPWRTAVRHRALIAALVLAAAIVVVSRAR